MQQEMHDA